MTTTIKRLTNEKLWAKYTGNKWRFGRTFERYEILSEIYHKAKSKFHSDEKYNEVVNFIYDYYYNFHVELQNLEDETNEMEIELEKRGIWYA